MSDVISSAWVIFVRECHFFTDRTQFAIQILVIGTQGRTFFLIKSREKEGNSWLQNEDGLTCHRVQAELWVPSDNSSVTKNQSFVKPPAHFFSDFGLNKELLEQSRSTSDLDRGPEQIACC